MVTPVRSRPIDILAVTGSLRAASVNTALLRAAAMVAPPNVRVVVFTGLDTLPHFNPDLDREGAAVAPPVAAFRQQVCAAAALLISSPEYAHGVPGAFKNALDWLVSVPDLPGKPVGLLDASPRATHARASLTEILRTMSLVMVPAASPVLHLRDRNPDAAVLAADPKIGAPLRDAVSALLGHLQTAGSLPGPARAPDAPGASWVR